MLFQRNVAKIFKRPNSKVGAEEKNPKKLETKESKESSDVFGSDSLSHDHHEGGNEHKDKAAVVNFLKR